MDENDTKELKEDEVLQDESITLQKQGNPEIKEARKMDFSVLWNWLEDFPSLRIALVMVMGIIILILLGVLFGYMAAVFNLIKL